MIIRMTISVGAGGDATSISSMRMVVPSTDSNRHLDKAIRFGRTGAWTGSRLWGVQPDMMCLGKGITGGYLPLAATLISEKVFEQFLAPHERYEAFVQDAGLTVQVLPMRKKMQLLAVCAA